MSDTKEYWNELIALITYLGCTEFNSRRSKPMAKDLGLSHDRVEEALKANTSFFRKSRNTIPDTKEHYWTLQLRYALKGKGVKRGQEKGSKKRGLKEKGRKGVMRKGVKSAVDLTIE